MRKFVPIFLTVLVCTLVGCKDKSDEIKNDEAYFIGEWTATYGRILVTTGSQLPSVGAEMVYSFQNGGKLNLKSPWLQPSTSGEVTGGTGGSIVLSRPESLWSYVSGSKQLLLFIPQKMVYDIIQVDKDNFTAIDTETNYQLKFTRK